MRILLIHNHYQQAGGEDAVFAQEAELLRQRGHTVEMLTFTNEGFDGSVVGMMSGAVRSVYNRTSARRVTGVIDRFRPDVVHIHNLFYTASPAVIRAAKRRGIPVVMTLHNYRLVCNSGLLMREAEMPCERCLTQTLPLAGIRHGCFRGSRVQSAQLTAITSLHKLTGTWQSVDRFIVLTEFARQKILQSSLRLAPEQVVVKPNSVDDLGVDPVTDRADSFLYVGRLTVDKGILVLLEAARQTTHRIDIIGDGPLRAAVEQAAATYPNVRYLGQLARPDVLTRLQQCRALLVPSLWYEGLPTVILEAFATGTPVICSDQQNLNHIVADRQTGLLFKTGDASVLVQVLDSLTPQQAKQYGRAGYDQFLRHYTHQANGQHLEAVYASVCASTLKISPIGA